MPSPISPQFIWDGLRREVLQPMRKSFQDGNRVIKGVRDAYPTLDMVAGIHPGIAAAQVANDMATQTSDEQTALNVLQAIPLLRRANKLTKQGEKFMGFSWNKPATYRKNIALTAASPMVGMAEAE